MLVARIPLVSNPPTSRAPPVSSRYIQQQKTGLKSRLAIRMSAQGKGGTAEQNGGSELPLHYTPDGRLPKPTKLSLVVTDAVRRWYLETEREAERGEVKSQALLGQMLIEGYGCEPDPARGKELAEKARRRGYRMDGVYCKI